jgi:hypothetical protein
MAALLAIGATLLFAGTALRSPRSATARQFDVTGTPWAYLPFIARQEDVVQIFPVGPGGSDVVPHQIVRTADDRVYLFVSQQYSTTIRVYWTTTPGLPGSGAAFDGFAQIATGSNPISLDAVYDGGNFIHVLVNAQNGTLKDYPFDARSNAFQSAITLVASGNPTVSGDYVGTSGVSGMYDQGDQLHVAYWSSGNNITHRAYTYAGSTNSLTQIGSDFPVENGPSKTNHPAVAVSPLDDSLTVTWVSEATEPAASQILARTRSVTGTWSGIETVSAADAWTSANFGVNIDQGPSLVIDADGAKHLTYIEDVDGTGNYGRVHYVVNAGAGWIDQAVPAYSHDPAIILNSVGNLYILGHGHPRNGPLQGGGPCLDMRDMCRIKKNADATWGPSQLIVAHSSATSFDASPSVKWSVVGFNRPETIEFIVFEIVGGDYNHPTIYYGRF